MSLTHGNKAVEFIENKLEGALEEYQRAAPVREGVEKMIIECDGCDIRTGRLREMRPEEKQFNQQNCLGQKNGKARRKRDTNWREVRLIATQRFGEADASYLATMEKSDAVGQKMFSLAVLEGMGDRTEMLGIGDGAVWIAEEFKSHFPNGWFLLDKYHLIENIYKATDGLKTKSDRVKKRWVLKQVERIESGLIEQVLKDCDKKAGGNKDSPLFHLKRYIEERRDFLDYKRAEEGLWPVGSGIVESGHKHVIQKRLKLPGTWWKEENVNPMCALPAIRSNHWWEDYWKREALTN